MKIPLFIKPYSTKVCFAIALGLYIGAHGTHAEAGFLSNLVSKVIGPETQAAEVSPVVGSVTHNSQTIPLPESSINPDMKNIKDEPVLAMVSDDEALISNTGPAGTDSDLEKYASTEKIDVYTIKKGDTLEGIAKKLKVSKDSILSANSDLKKTDLLKIGQTLVILDAKATVDEDTKVVAVAKDSTDKVTTKKADTEKKKDDAVKEVVKKEVTPAVTKVKEVAPVIPVQATAVTTLTPVQAPVAVPQPQIQATVTTSAVSTNTSTILSTPVAPSVEVIPPPTVSNGQPAGTIVGGYIWPFPAGVGRVSQGLHADQAYDFAAPKDTPIYAIQSGKVLIVHPSGYNGGYGKYVVINFDDGRQAIFGHMNKTVAIAGQTVKQGDIIGYVGSTGQSTGNHTHIGFRGSLGNPYKGLKVNSTGIDHD